MKIITAIGEPYINNKLRKRYEVIGKDILYQEGILEILDERNDIDLLILSNNLPNEYDFKILIDKILKKKENIEIIVFLKKKDENIENYLNSKNIYKIFYLDDLGYESFFNTFCINTDESKQKKIQNEIQDFKEILLNNTNKNEFITDYYLKSEKKELEDEPLYVSNQDKLKRKKSEFNLKNFLENKNENIINKILNKEKMKKAFEISGEIFKEDSNDFLKDNKTKTIVVSGNNGSGKTIVSVILSKYIEKQNKKVLLIDFDITNNSINSVLGIKNKKIENELENCVTIVNKNLCILSEIDRLLNYFEIYKINMFLEEIKKQFDFIIVDFSFGIESNLLKTFLTRTDKIIYLLEPNLLEIKKAKSYLEIYVADYKINLNKIKILFNKVNKYKISDFVLEEIFYNFEIIGNIEYDEKYSLFINKNFNNINYKEEYKNIYEKL